MHNSYSVFLINTKVRAIAVAYEPGDNAPTTLFKSFDDSIVVGDYVVIETDTRHNMTVGLVRDVDVEIDFNNANSKISWIVDVVDQSVYKDILNQEREALSAIQRAEMRKKREELRDAMFKDQEETLKSLQIASAPDGADK